MLLPLLLFLLLASAASARPEKVLPMEHRAVADAEDVVLLPDTSGVPQV